MSDNIIGLACDDFTPVYMTTQGTIYKGSVSMETAMQSNEKAQIDQLKARCDQLYSTLTKAGRILYGAEEIIQHDDLPEVMSVWASNRQIDRQNAINKAAREVIDLRGKIRQVEELGGEHMRLDGKLAAAMVDLEIIKQEDPFTTEVY